MLVTLVLSLVAALACAAVSAWMSAWLNHPLAALAGAGAVAGAQLFMSGLMSNSFYWLQIPFLLSLDTTMCGRAITGTIRLLPAAALGYVSDMMYVASYPGSLLKGLIPALIFLLAALPLALHSFLRPRKA